MFSKEDYINYFLQVRKVELAMHDRFASYAARVDDPALKKQFLALERQETAHSRIVDDMLTAFGYEEKKKD